MNTRLRFSLAASILLGFALTAAAQQVPAQAEAERIVSGTVKDFSAAVMSGDFTAFHAQTATQLKAKYTPAQLKEAYAAFVEAKIDVAPLVQGLKPTFDPPIKLGDDGVLKLEGSFPSTPRVTFRCSYVYQAGGWKPLGVGVVKEAATGRAAPAPADAQRLVLQTLQEFSDAVSANDFSALHARGSTPLRKQLTPAKLKESFAAFVDQKINVVALMKSKTAEFDGQPSIDDDGVLVLKGTYQGKSGPIRFTVKYVFEDGEWRWLALNVKT